MEDSKIQLKTNEQGQIANIELGGMLVLENIQTIKKELVGALSCLADRVKISVIGPTEIDLSFIQLLVAMIRQMDKLNILYRIDWQIDDDQKLLLEQVGMSNELFLIN
jgi:hypothetical protein